MKELPQQIGKEIFLKMDYLICRFMNKKYAYKIDQNQKTYFTIKKIQDQGKRPQYQFHIRFEGKDTWFNDNDIIDFDFYIDESEKEKIKEVII